MTAADPIAVRVVGGPAIEPWLPDVAALRIDVFRAFPYLYDGDADYERNYLTTYAKSPDSVFVLAFDGERVIGASTGIPLADDGEAFQRPFRERGIDVGTVFYFGESVLLPAYRGRGIGHRFFDEREAWARRLGRFETMAFAAVDRDADDPRKPIDHHGNEAFWSKRGYLRQPGLRMQLRWKEVGEVAESEKQLTFWTRQLDR